MPMRERLVVLRCRTRRAGGDLLQVQEVQAGGALLVRDAVQLLQVHVSLELLPLVLLHLLPT